MRSHTLETRQNNLQFGAAQWYNMQHQLGYNKAREMRTTLSAQEHITLSSEGKTQKINK